MNKRTEQKYGCNNCIRQSTCRSRHYECSLKVCVIEHLLQDNKIKPLIATLNNLKMHIVVNSRGFQIVSI